MKETIEHNNRFYGEELKTESEQLKEWLIVANKEIERLNNIINKGIEYIEERFTLENGEYYLTHTFNKDNVKELYDILRGDKE